MPVDVGRHRGRGLARRQRAQVVRRGLRLLAVLRARSARSDACDVHQPELSANGGRRRGKESQGLGTSARPALSGAQAVVSHPRPGSGGTAGPSSARPRQRTLARRAGARNAALASARAGTSPDGVRSPRAAEPIRRGARRAYARLGRSAQPLGPLPYGSARTPTDRASREHDIHPGKDQP